MRRLQVFLTLLLSMAACPDLSNAQCTPPPLRTWIRFADNGTCVDTLWFSVGSQATYGIDPALCEEELPPPPPAGVCDFRFVNKPGREGSDVPAGLGQGTKQDYRSRPPLLDTFRVRMQPGEGGYPIFVSWSPERVRSMCDSVFLVDEFGGLLVKRAMHRDSEAVILNTSITSLLIAVETVVTGTGNQEKSTRPPLHLHEGCPNPFNPTTDLSFELPERTRVTLVVHDLLGRTIAVLAEGEFAAGSHTVRWEAAHAAAGTYLARLTAMADQGRAIHTQSRKLLLVK